MSGLLALGLGFWQNQFPYWYHPDEDGKALQLLRGERNLHHPLLLLESVDLARGFVPSADDIQSVTVLGRSLSAGYTALAVGLLALTLGCAMGPAAAWIAGLLAALHWNIFEYAHYFKEDPAFCFGVMAVFAALGWWRRSPGFLAAAVLGLSLGLACSGKYIGVVLLLPVIIAMIRVRPESAARAWGAGGVALLGALGLFALINHDIWLHPEVFQASLDKEIHGVLESEEPEGEPVFDLHFFERFWPTARLGLVPGLLMLLVFGWFRRRQWPLEIHLLVWFPVLLAFVLGFSTKHAGRYFEPAVFALCGAAAVGWAAWLDWCRQRVRQGEGRRWIRVGVTVLAALITFGGSLNRLVQYMDGFRVGTRDLAVEWIRAELPPDAVLAQSEITGFADPAFPGREMIPARISQQILTIDNLAETDTMESLRQRGVTHLLVSESEWKHSERFWKQVRKHSELVLELDARKIPTHGPPLRIYELN